MDWSRAKNILIAVFLILNIYLLTSIGIEKVDNKVNTDALNNTIKILNAKNVDIRCKIPTYHSETPYIDYESNKLDRSKIAKVLLGEGSFLSTQTEKGEKQVSGSKTLLFENHDTFVFTDESPDKTFDTEDREKIEKSLREFLKNLGFTNISSYILDEYKRDDEGNISVIFTQKYKDFLIFDNYVKVILRSGGISMIECKYKKVKGFIDQKESIMPAHQVLLKNFMDYSDIVISNIDIGFKGYVSGGDTKKYYQGPAWRVELKSGERMYYRAADGVKLP